MGKTIAQLIAWSKATDVKVSPPSVKSHAVLSGIGLTVNGAKVATVSIPRGTAATAFDAAMVAGRTSVKVERIGRGRPSTVRSAADYATALRKATAKAPRKARSTTPAPTSTDSAPSA